MTPESYRGLAQEAARQAAAATAVSGELKRLSQAITQAIGGTSTSADRRMCALLDQAATRAASASRDLSVARQEATKAAAKAEAAQRAKKADQAGRRR